MMRISTLFLVLCFSLNISGQNKIMHPLSTVEFLIGKWVEKTDESTVVHEYQWVFGKQFIQSSTDAQFSPTAGEESAHQDIGFFSFDQVRDKIIFRQFHSEGFINTYILDEERSSDTFLLFATEETENAGDMRAELTINKKSDEEYEMILHLAPEAGEFKACQWINAVKIE